MVSRSNQRGSRCVALLLCAATLAACDDEPGQGLVREPRPPHFAVNTDACGAEYTSIEATYDSVLAAHGSPLVIDTSQVCQTWTGSDYDYRIDFIGRGNWESDTDPETEHALEFQAKTLTSLDSSGAQMGTAIQLPVTGLDYVNADAATRAAIADDPYFGLRAIGECDSDPREFQCSTEPNPSTNSPAQAHLIAGSGVRDEICRDPGIICEPSDATASLLRTTSVGDGVPRVANAVDARNWSVEQVSTNQSAYTRHGVRRRGVRALIDSGEELERTSNDRRRFRVNRGAGFTTYEVQPAAGLLMAQEWSDPRGQGRWDFVWRRVSGGYVLDRIEMQQRDRNPDGTEIPSRSLQLIADLHLR